MSPPQKVIQMRNTFQSEIHHSSVGMTIRFLGACGEVVPSGYFLENDRADLRFLVDCGGNPTGPEGLMDLPCDPADLSFVIVTHGHFDHIGGLPLLVKAGFAGKIYATTATQRIAAISLRDAVGHEERRRGEARFTAADVERVMRLFRPVDGRPDWTTTPYQLAPGVRALFQPNGHIIGSCQVKVLWDGPRREHAILFSGDVGPSCPQHANSTVLRSPMVPGQGADGVVVESTYGGTVRSMTDRSPVERRARLKAELVRGWARGGPIIIPTFAIGRQQDLLVDLHILAWEDPHLFDGAEVIVTRGMGMKVSRVYAETLASTAGSVWRSKSLARAFDIDDDDPMLPGLIKQMFIEGDPAQHFAKMRRLWVSKPVEDINLQRLRHRKTLIVAGGGMGAGPVEHLLKHAVVNERASVFFAGYCGADTIGKQLQQVGLGRRRTGSIGFKTAKVDVPCADIKAHIGSLTGYSAHADQAALVEWCVPKHPARNAAAPLAPFFFVTHGDDPSRDGLQRAIEKRAGLVGSSVRTCSPSKGDRWSLEGPVPLRLPREGDRGENRRRRASPKARRPAPARRARRPQN
jgi:metallo-beta-lactamase family protein